MKYFEKYSSAFKTTIYGCQIDDLSYYFAEYRVGLNYDETWTGCFYDYDIGIDLKDWEERGELPDEMKVLPQNVMHKMIECIIQ